MSCIFLPVCPSPPNAFLLHSVPCPVKTFRAQRKSHFFHECPDRPIACLWALSHVEATAPSLLGPGFRPAPQTVEHPEVDGDRSQRNARMLTCTLKWTLNWSDCILPGSRREPRRGLRAQETAENAEGVRSGPGACSGTETCPPSHRGSSGKEVHEEEQMTTLTCSPGGLSNV